MSLWPMCLFLFSFCVLKLPSVPGGGQLFHDLEDKSTKDSRTEREEEPGLQAPL